MNSNEKESMVRDIFKSISGKYDFFDSIMSLGMDKRWRKLAVSMLDLRHNLRVADVGAGSGKVTEEMLSSISDLKIDAIDLTREMFPRAIGNVNFTVASAEKIPFDASTFQRCISCFLTRNVPVLENYINEVYRILDDGGIFVNMDIFDPGKSLIAPAFRFYFYRLMPRILDMASHTKSYSYLASSVQAFVTPDQFSDLMKKAGFRNIRVKKLAGGSVYIHKGIK